MDDSESEQQLTFVVAALFAAATIASGTEVRVDTWIPNCFKFARDFVAEARKQFPDLKLPP